MRKVFTGTDLKEKDSRAPFSISSGEKYGFTTWISLGNHALYPFISKD
jgi:hypothetical protein